MVRSGFINEYPKDTCSKDIGLHAQNIITILDSTIKIIGETLYDHLMSMIIFTFNIK